VGDTGNANGTNHLHFEIRDDGAQDPYPRIQEEFTLEEKTSFLEEILKEISDEEDLAALLVGHYAGIFLRALSEGVDLPEEIKDALDDFDLPSDIRDVSTDLSLGDENGDVMSLQLFLIRANIGPEAKKLAQSGATGYFGSITQNALVEYQVAFGIEPADGYFGARTREAVRIEGEVHTVVPKDSTAKESLVKLMAALDEILSQIPKTVTYDLTMGDERPGVSLVQMYLIFKGDGPATRALKEAGATGYYGALTKEALREFQQQRGIAATGIYDAVTRNAMAVYE
jgi:peptidoglycan hydrolase-like protein with peptidoglycan-binding domain